MNTTTTTTKKVIKLGHFKNQSEFIGQLTPAHLTMRAYRLL